jgi:hypothetical protein
MECDYTCLNHNLLVSQKKVVIKGVIMKRVCCNFLLTDFSVCLRNCIRV